MVDPLDPGLARKLDAFAVPSLPRGFADRAVAAALGQSGEQPATGLPSLPRPRTIARRRWLRRGAMGLGGLAVGMVSISAAALGYLGEPVQRTIQQAPVIGKVIERVVPEEVRPRLATPSKASVAAVRTATPSQELSDVEERRRASPLLRRQEVRRILADPEARKVWLEAHPEAARAQAERRAVRRAVREELRMRRLEAGIVPNDGTAARVGAERPIARPWRLERRERLRELRERRRDLHQNGEPVVTPADPLVEPLAEP